MGDLPPPAAIQPNEIRNMFHSRVISDQQQLQAVTTGSKNHLYNLPTTKNGLLKRNTVGGRSKTYLTPMKREHYIVHGRYDLLEILK